MHMNDRSIKSRQCSSRSRVGFGAGLHSVIAVERAKVLVWRRLSFLRPQLEYDRLAESNTVKALPASKVDVRVPRVARHRCYGT